MSAPAETVDTLIHPGWIIPVAPSGQVLENHSLAILDGQIAAILPRAETARIAAAEVVELPGHALLPGLVNAHGHAARSLLGRCIKSRME